MWENSKSYWFVISVLQFPIFLFCLEMCTPRVLGTILNPQIFRVCEIFLNWDLFRELPNIFSIVQIYSPLYHYTISNRMGNLVLFLGLIQLFWKNNNRWQQNWIKLCIWGYSHKPTIPKNQGFPHSRNLGIQDFYQPPCVEF